MNNNMYIWIAIFGGCVVTVLPRVLPITLMSKIKVNSKVSDFLKYVPIAILAALVAQNLFIVDEKVSLTANPLELIVAIFVSIVAIKKNNLLITVISGVILIALLRFIF